MHRVLRREIQTFYSRCEESGRDLPKFVRREFDAYLACGVLSNGFVRVRCQDCGDDRLVAFSCKGRGFCPSCTGRRMADTAAPLVDRVLPHAPIRQWVLSLPIQIRPMLAYDAALSRAVLNVFLRTVFAWHRRRAKQLGIKNAQCGAVTAIQRFGSALNLNLHYHVLVLDGVFHQAAGARLADISCDQSTDDRRHHRADSKNPKAHRAIVRTPQIVRRRPRGIVGRAITRWILCRLIARQNRLWRKCRQAPSALALRCSCASRQSRARRQYLGIRSACQSSSQSHRTQKTRTTGPLHFARNQYVSLSSSC